ncbi:MAG: N-6 DNA methylase [Dehalococcoidia bacterium]
MMLTSEAKLRDELQNYGLNRASIRLFGDLASPELIDYLDLVEPKRLDQGKELLPDGVAESQGRPLLFFVNESRLSLSPKETESKLGHLRRILACRGDRVYLARVRPGQLSVVPVSLSDKTPEWKLYDAKSSEAITFFSRLAQGRFDGKGEPDEVDFVFNEMLSLLNQAADQLAKVLGPANVLSLLGRALFFRFLFDRNIVTDNDTKRIAPQAGSLTECFDNAENAYATSHWLDLTFNGDFLTLEDGGSHAFFTSMAKRSGSVFFHLSAIVRRLKPIGTGAYQTKLQWSDFDFAHVPVGLLSQVYEAFCWKWEHRNAKETSVYYTPRRIAAILVDEAFESLPDAHNARVLDPACGAGVFLVLAFRRLYCERWKVGKRPETGAIREILERQITGFDISSSALKLSALGLYLTAIELDPNPIPPEKLRFKELNNRVLFNHRRQDVDEVEGPVIGSLGEHVGSRFDGQFDLVLSNPPWTSWSEKYKPLAYELTTVSRAIIKRKGEDGMARNYQNADFAPDMPILWKSTEWCKSGGRIAMALPARIILKQELIPTRARETMFRLIEVTGIMNGSNLSDTDVWPKMSQPFLLFFARNRRPNDGHVIRLITPQYDKSLNRKGEIRIDSKSAQSVEVTATLDEPWLWKALTIGTPLDAEVIRHIRSVEGKRVTDYWIVDLGLTSSTGYMIKAKQKQQDSHFMHELPNLTADYKGRFSVDATKLNLFTRLTVSRPRKRDIYRAPLVLVKASPEVNPIEGRALLSLADVAYSESYYGYSGYGHPNGELLVRYLQLFVHSSIWLYYSLLVSPEFGAERRKIQKTDLDGFPLVPIESIVHDQHEGVMNLSERLLREDRSVFTEIDTFFGGLYGLDDLDLEVIRDTLDVCLPYGESRARACNAPTDAELETFRQRLESVLRPFFRVLGKDPQVIVWKPDNAFLQKEAPFGIVLVGYQGHIIKGPDALFRDVILRLADDTGATRITQQIEGGLLVGILRQYRYWTRSRARLLGAEIVRQHMTVFEE